MKTISALLLLALAGLPCSSTSKKTASTEAKTEPVAAANDCRAAALTDGTTVMAGLTLEASTPISDLLEDPKTYKEKTVRIEGTVVEVCAKAGCFVALDDGHGRQVNLKVTDGEVDFREMAKAGVYAIGEGEVMPRGPHGFQVFITGAQIGKAVCN